MATKIEGSIRVGAQYAAPIPGFSGYYVTTNGAVYSVVYGGRRPRKPRKGAKRKPPRKINPYYDERFDRMNVRLVRNGRTHQPRLADVVLATWDYSNWIPGSCARHINGNTVDDRVDNLYWDHRLYYTDRGQVRFWNLNSEDHT